MKRSVIRSVRLRLAPLAAAFLAVCLGVAGSPGYAVPSAASGASGIGTPVAPSAAPSIPAAPEPTRTPAPVALPLSIPSAGGSPLKTLPLPSLPPTDLTPFRKATPVQGGGQQATTEIVAYPKISYQTVYCDAGPVLSEEDRKKLEAILAEIKREIEQLQEERNNPPAQTSHGNQGCGGSEGLACDAGDMVPCTEPVCRDERLAEKQVGSGDPPCQEQPGTCDPAEGACGPGQHPPPGNR